MRRDIYVRVCVCVYAVCFVHDFYVYKRRALLVFNQYTNRHTRVPEKYRYNALSHRPHPLFLFPF